MVVFVMYSKNTELFVRNMIKEINLDEGFNFFYVEYGEKFFPALDNITNTVFVFHEGGLEYRTGCNIHNYHLRGLNLGKKVLTIQSAYYSSSLKNDLLKIRNKKKDSGLQTTSTDKLKIASLVLTEDGHRLVEHGYGSPEIMAAALPDLNLITSNLEEYSGCPLVIGKY